MKDGRQAGNLTALCSNAACPAAHCIRASLCCWRCRGAACDGGWQACGPSGHRLVLEGAERAQLAFTAKGVECRAGVPHTTLVQLLDHQGYPLQVSMCFNWVSVNLSAGRQMLSSDCSAQPDRLLQQSLCIGNSRHLSALPEHLQFWALSTHQVLGA